MTFVAMVEAMTLASTQNGTAAANFNANSVEAMTLAETEAAIFSATVSVSTWWTYAVQPANLNYLVAKTTLAGA
jgi:hypothetical protein